jgi:hypothetical protein
MIHVQFVPGNIPEETILELVVDKDVCERVHAYISQWASEAYDLVRYSGYTCPSFGESDETSAWAQLNDGPISVDLTSSKIQLTFWNEPEGDDRLDGQHPHWTQPHDHLWMLAVPRVRQILEGTLR